MNWSKVFILLFVGTAVGCVVWFGLFQDVHKFKREVSQENRRAETVGAKPLPVQSIKVVIKNKARECRVIDSAALDGGELTVYWHNACQEIPQSSTIHWDALAPDGTVIHSDYAFINQDLNPGQRGEFVFDGYRKLPTDPRIATIEVKARYNDNP